MSLSVNLAGGPLGLLPKHKYENAEHQIAQGITYEPPKGHFR